MLTLKNVFWVVLVLLNLTFILAVSYSRLKPTPEVTPNPLDNKIASEEISPNSASWRFAAVNTTDIPALELPDPSSPKSVNLVSETADKAVSGTPAPMVETKAISNAHTAKSEMNSSKATEASFGAPKVASSDTTNEATSSAYGVANFDSAKNSRPDLPEIADSQMANTNFSDKTEGLTITDNATNKVGVASSAFGSNTIEVAAASMAASRVAETVRPDTDKQLIENSLSPEEANKKNKQDQEIGYKVDTYYDGNLVRTEETDKNGNLQVTVKENMDGLAELSSNDANYIEALNQLNNGQQTPKTNTDVATASDLAKEGNSKKSVDYFNKVDVSSRNNQRPDNELALADQIAAAVSADNPSNEKNSIPNNPESDYFQALGTESAERTNEMRTIKIVRGDTLWSIASRAYGSGFEYKKIFKANPYLTDPDKIKVGDTLRVPI